jgi:hypothetical protein
VGLVDRLRCGVPNNLRGRLCTQHLLVVPVRLRRRLRTGERVLELFKLCLAVQFVFDLYRRIRSRSSVPVWIVVRM